MLGLPFHFLMGSRGGVFLPGPRYATIQIKMKTSVGRQITVALENQPGQLAKVCALLIENAISINAICVIDNVEQGVIRLMVSDPARCKAALKSRGFYAIESDILVIDLTDRPGKLAQIAGRLAAANINIDYVYGSVELEGSPIRLILKASDHVRARPILEHLEDDAE
jgi:hypothetical protein